MPGSRRNAMLKYFAAQSGLSIPVGRPRTGAKRRMGELGRMIFRRSGYPDLYSRKRRKLVGGSSPLRRAGSWRKTEGRGGGASFDRQGHTRIGKSHRGAANAAGPMLRRRTSSSKREGNAASLMGLTPGLAVLETSAVKPAQGKSVKTDRDHGAVRIQDCLESLQDPKAASPARAGWGEGASAGPQQHFIGTRRYQWTTAGCGSEARPWEGRQSWSVPLHYLNLPPHSPPPTPGRG